MSEQVAIHMVVTIVDRGRCEKVVSVCQDEGVPIHLVSLGHGTARTEMLDLLGLGETKKDTVISFVPEYTVCPLLERLAEEYPPELLDSLNGGILLLEEALAARAAAR